TDNGKCPGPYVHAGRPDDPCPLPASLGEEARYYSPVEYGDAEAAHLVKEGRLNIASPHAHHVAVLIVIGEHELCLFVPEFGALELIFDVPDLDSHPLAVEKGVPALFGVYIAGRAAGITTSALHDGPRIGFRGHLRARIGAGGVPVVDPRPSGSASLGGAFFEDHYSGASFCRTYGGVTPRYASAHDEDVTDHVVLCP